MRKELIFWIVTITVMVILAITVIGAWGIFSVYRTMPIKEQYLMAEKIRSYMTINHPKVQYNLDLKPKGDIVVLYRDSSQLNEFNSELQKLSVDNKYTYYVSAAAKN